MCYKVHHHRAIISGPQWWQSFLSSVLFWQMSLAKRTRVASRPDREAGGLKHYTRFSEEQSAIGVSDREAAASARTPLALNGGRLDSVVVAAAAVAAVAPVREKRRERGDAHTMRGCHCEGDEPGGYCIFDALSMRAR